MHDALCDNTAGAHSAASRSCTTLLTCQPVGQPYVGDWPLCDYDDIVVGLKVVAIPEPESYALMLARLAAVGFVSRRRSRRA